MRVFARSEKVLQLYSLACESAKEHTVSCIINQLSLLTGHTIFSEQGNVFIRLHVNDDDDEPLGEKTDIICHIDAEWLPECTASNLFLSSLTKGLKQTNGL